MKLKLVPFLIVLLTAVITAQLVLLSQPATVTALPPRPTPTAVPTQAPGATISLHVAGEIANNNWTKIQWQDANAKWHDVSGWQGELEADGTKTWWVGEELLGSGPFRWVILEAGEIVTLSDTFYMPTTLNETLEITVSLD